MIEICCDKMLRAITARRHMGDLPPLSVELNRVEVRGMPVDVFQAIGDDDFLTCCPWCGFPPLQKKEREE